MRKLETLLELWEYRCEHYENGGLDRVIMDWQTTVKEKSTALDPVINKDIAFAAESLLKPEPFTTKILHQLLLKQKDFRVKFLERIGFKTDLPDVRTEYHEEIKDPEEIEKYTNSYDISFWEDDKLVCIVENKLDADFSDKKEYTENGNKIKIPQQLERYCKALVKYDTEEPTLVTLTKFDEKDNPKVIGAVNKTYKTETGEKRTVRFVPLLWHEIAKLVADYAVEGGERKIFRQAKELFYSEYFLLHDNMSQKITRNYRDVLIEKIESIAKEYQAEIICHRSKNLGNRTIALRQKKYPEVDFCGGLMALSIWFNSYSVTGEKKHPQDKDTPNQLTNKPFPFFDITLKCYYQLEDKKIFEEDFDKITELKQKGYEPLRSKSFYHGSPKQEFLYKSFAEVTGNRISDEESLKEQIYNADSELWEFLKEEISAWQKIVCNN